MRVCEHEKEKDNKNTHKTDTLSIGTFPTKNLTNWTIRYPGRRLSCDVFLKTVCLPRTGEFFFTIPSRPCE